MTENLKCPECGEDSKNLQGFGLEDMMNDMLRCTECNYKKYPWLKKQHEEYKKQDEEREFLETVRRSLS